jgi:hypothetical protein
MSSYVSAAFFDPQRADRAVEELIAIGYPREKIDVMMSRETHAKYARGHAPGESQGANVARNEPGGEVLGVALGTIAGGVAATGVIAGTVATGGLALPFIAGPLAAVIAGGGAGAALGNVLGALLSTGIPKEHAERLAHDIDAGAIAVGVKANDGDAARVRLLLADGATEASRDDGAPR